MAAHFFGSLQTVAYLWPFRLAEECAAVIDRQVNAAHSRRFAVGYARNRR